MNGTQKKEIKLEENRETENTLNNTSYTSVTRATNTLVQGTQIFF